MLMGALVRIKSKPEEEMKGLEKADTSPLVGGQRENSDI
jgi:hypothetical protein